MGFQIARVAPARLSRTQPIPTGDRTLDAITQIPWWRSWAEFWGSYLIY
jgi:hypothetical protein